MKRTRWVAILVAMIMLAGALPFGIAEDEVASAPVDTFVAEAIDAQVVSPALEAPAEEAEIPLWTEDMEEASEESARAVSAVDESDIPIDEAHFPDDYFREVYISWKFDLNGDGFLSYPEREAATKIDFRKERMNNGRVTTVKGIEYLPFLLILDCSGSSITSLDVSQNPNLEKLDCSHNQLTSLDVSHQGKLMYLDCSGNKGLSALDLRYNKFLDYLNCMECALTSLDVSNNMDLKELWCAYNQITGLDVNSHVKLEKLQCGNNSIVELNAKGCKALDWLYCSGNNIQRMELAGCTALKELLCEKNALINLSLRGLTAIEHVECIACQLKQLDVRGLTALTYLDCSVNELSSLDVSTNPNLEYLICAAGSYENSDTNSIESLDISNCQILREIVLDKNHLVDNSGGIHAYGRYVGGESVRNITFNNYVKLIIDGKVVNTPVAKPTAAPTAKPTAAPTAKPTAAPTVEPGDDPTEEPGDQEFRYYDVVISGNATVTCLNVDSVNVVLDEAVYGNGDFPEEAESSNEDVVDYIGGRFSAYKAGKETLTVKTYHGHKLTLTFNVVKDGKSLKLKLNKSKATMTVGSTSTLGPVQMPLGVTNEKITWTSSDPKVAKVDADGRVTALKKGTATVTAKAVNGQSAACKITVKALPKVTGLALKAGRKQLTVTWKQAKGVAGYQIQYSLKKNFSGAKAVKVGKAATVKKVVKKLKSGATYYVRVRAYNQLGKKTFYSAWSKAKTVKVK